VCSGKVREAASWFTMPKKSQWHLKEDNNHVFIFSGNKPVNNPANPEKALGYVLDAVMPRSKKNKSSDGVTVSI